MGNGIANEGSQVGKGKIMSKCGAKTEVYSRVCVICERRFMPKNQVQKTCSKACSREMFNIRRKEWRRKRKTERENTTAICPVCGDKFTMRHGRIYCSKKCADSAWLKTPIGKSYKQAKDARYNAKPESKNRKNFLFLTRWRKNPELRIKMVARKIALRAFPVMEPCIECGKVPAERHHPDYRNPTEIVWLCKEHHEQYHAKENNNGEVRKTMLGI